MVRVVDDDRRSLGSGARLALLLGQVADNVFLLIQFLAQLLLFGHEQVHDRSELLDLGSLRALRERNNFYRVLGLVVKSEGDLGG